MAERPDDTRVRLLEAAGEVFAEKGFQAATVREICSRAGANVAAVNYHFGDKQRLYVEVMRYAHRGFAEHPLPRWAPGTPLADKLRAFIEQMLADMQEDAGPSWRRRLMMREMAEPTEACLAVMHAFIQPRREMLREILGEILPPDLPEADRQLIAYSIVGQCLFHRVHWPIVKMMTGEEMFRSFDLARLTEHITRFSLAALGHAPGVGQAFQPDMETAEIGGRRASGWKA
jgi:AcrR family transcriptional regulator